MGTGASFCPGFHKANQLPPWSCPGFKPPRGPTRPGCEGACQGAGEARACKGAAVSRSAGWRTCSSTASCTCSSLPGATLLTSRKSSSGSATLFLVSVLLGALMVLGSLAWAWERAAPPTPAQGLTVPRASTACTHTVRSTGDQPHGQRFLLLGCPGLSTLNLSPQPSTSFHHQKSHKYQHFFFK